MDITKLQQKVLNVMRAVPATANDDALLLAIFWAREAQAKGREIDYVELYSALRGLTRAESITRRARELVEMGLVERSASETKKRRTAANNEVTAHSLKVNPHGLEDYRMKDTKDVVNDEVKQRLADTFGSIEVLEDGKWNEVVGHSKSKGDGFKKFMATKEMMKLKKETLVDEGRDTWDPNFKD